MKILLVINKTYKGVEDAGVDYVQKPLQDLGHEVLFYDTVRPEEPDFHLVVRSFQPDLVFCCITGDSNITPYEPLEAIKELTDYSKITTFNWFCDDIWRFDHFSSLVCFNFNYCSTPDRDRLDDYKEVGYKNILWGMWHANKNVFEPLPFDQREHEISFIGRVTQSRNRLLQKLAPSIRCFSGLTSDQFYHTFCNSKAVINFSGNDNAPANSKQIKQRVFETAAAGALVVTEYSPGLEDLFSIGEEIIAFESIDDLKEKLDNLEDAMEIAQKGHKRFLKDHESHVRLSNLLKSIEIEQDTTTRRSKP